MVAAHRYAAKPKTYLPRNFAQRMLNREAISIASPPTYLEARRRGDLGYFRRTMKPFVQRYDGTRVTTFWRRAAARIAHRLPPKGEAFLRRLVGRQRLN